MVVEGRFSACLVYADTKVPFKENTKDGKTYAEVEPGADYLVEVEVLSQGDYSAAHDDSSDESTQGGDGKVYLEVTVDDTDLGYYCTTEAENGSRYLGGYQWEGGVGTEIALRFDRPTLSTHHGDLGGAAAAAAAAATTSDRTMGMGKVRVRFSQAIYEGKAKRVEFSSQMPSCEISSQALSTSSKLVRTEQGVWSQSGKAPRVTTSYSRGLLLETITIHYCTALGLIHVGVLPRPPFWEFARLQAPASGSVDPVLANIAPKRIKREAIVQDGVLISRAKEYEMFDLTSIDTDSY